jgi:hypothetical protein
MVIWECEIKAIHDLGSKIQSFLEGDE